MVIQAVLCLFVYTSYQYLAAILLGHLKLDDNEVKHALYHMNEEILTPELVRQLLAYAPNKDEVILLLPLMDWCRDWYSFCFLKKQQNNKHLFFKTENKGIEFPKDEQWVPFLFIFEDKVYYFISVHPNYISEESYNRKKWKIHVYLPFVVVQMGAFLKLLGSFVSCFWLII